VAGPVPLSREREISSVVHHFSHDTMSPIALPGTEPIMDRPRARWLFLRRRRLTLFGRSVVLVGCELLANASCWIVAGILFGGRKDTQPILGLALLAWVCGQFPLCQRMQAINLFPFVRQSA